MRRTSDLTPDELREWRLELAQLNGLIQPGEQVEEERLVRLLAARQQIMEVATNHLDGLLRRDPPYTEADSLDEMRWGALKEKYKLVGDEHYRSKAVKKQKIAVAGQ